MANFETISRDDLKQKMDSEEQFVLIDVLGEQSYNRAHLPGAKMADAHRDDFVKQVSSLVPDKNTEVIVYCASFSCQLSPQAAEKLAEAGYTNVKDFEGGLKDWVEGGYDLEGAEAEEVKHSLA